MKQIRIPNEKTNIHPIGNTETLKLVGIWFLILTVFICEMVFYTWCRVQYLRTSYEISREAENYKKLMAIQNNLKIEISRLQSPERISKLSGRMGLIRPSSEQTVDIP